MRAQEKFDSLVRRGLLARNARGQFFKGKMAEALDVLDFVATKVQATQAVAFFVFGVCAVG